MNKDDSKNTFIRTFLTVIIVIGMLVWSFFFFLVAGMSGAAGHQLAAYEKIALLPWLGGAPLLISLWTFGEVSKKWTLVLLTLMVALPTYSWNAQKLEDYYDNKTLEELAKKDPIKALDRCASWRYNSARREGGLNDLAYCSVLIKSFPDTSVCKELCSKCNDTDKWNKRKDCAKQFVRYMDRNSPYDLCKSAGLLNQPLGDGRFNQRFYNDCLSDLRHLFPVLDPKEINDVTNKPLPDDSNTSP